jgi:hypothetical protein
MDGAVHRIDLHCCADVEASLFETERQSSGPRKEVHTYRSPSIDLSPQETHRYALPLFAGFSVHTARQLGYSTPISSVAAVYGGRVQRLCKIFSARTRIESLETWHNGIADGGARNSRLRE